MVCLEDGEAGGSGSDLGGEGECFPGAGGGLPEAGLPGFGVADDDVHEAIGVEVEEADAVVGAVGFAQRVAAEGVGGDAFGAVADVEEAEFFAVSFFSAGDEAGDLGVPDPAVGVEDEGEEAGVSDGEVDGAGEVGDGFGVVLAVAVLGFPVGRDGRGEFPGVVVDDVGEGVVVGDIDEAAEAGDVFGEAGLVFRGGVEDGEDGGVGGEEVAAAGGGSEDVGEESWGEGVHRVAAGHAESDGGGIWDLC